MQDAKTIYNIFINNFLKIESIEKRNETQFYKIYALKIKNLKNMNKIKSCIILLENILNTKIIYNFENDFLILQLEKKENTNFNILDFKNAIHQAQQKSPSEAVVFLGFNKTNGAPVFEKLDNIKSLLIGGASGYGKSSFLHNIILSYLLLNKQSYLFLIDPKKTELNFYTKRILKNRLIIETGYNYNDFIKILKSYYNLIESRFIIMNKKQQRKSDAAPVLLVVDEFSILYTNNKEKAEILKYINKIAAVGRAARCYMILTTQHATNANINNTIRSNLQSRAAFKCENIQQSKNIIESCDAVKLRKPGEAIIKIDGKQQTEIKTAFLNESDIIKILES